MDLSGKHVVVTGAGRPRAMAVADWAIELGARRALGDLAARKPAVDFVRSVSPPALADVICFLASEGVSALHRTLIPVAGRM